MHFGGRTDLICTLHARKDTEILLHYLKIEEYDGETLTCNAALRSSFFLFFTIFFLDIAFIMLVKYFLILYARKSFQRTDHLIKS